MERKKRGTKRGELSVLNERASGSANFDFYLTFCDYPIRSKLIIDHDDFGEITIDYHPNQDLPVFKYQEREEIHPTVNQHALHFTKDIITALEIRNELGPLSQFYVKPCVKSLFLSGHDIGSLILRGDTFRILRKHGPSALKNLTVLSAIQEWFDSPRSLAANLTKMTDALLDYEKEKRPKRKKGPSPVELLTCLRRERFLSIYRLFSDVAKEAKKNMASWVKVHGHTPPSICHLLDHTLGKRLKGKRYFTDYGDGFYLRIEHIGSKYGDEEDFERDFVFELFMATEHPFSYFTERNYSLKQELEGTAWEPNKIAKLVLADIFRINYSTLENYLYRKPKS